MAKQIYIDENGNEVPVSGTIATAGNLPLGYDFSDPNSTAGALGDLTTLTTTDKSSAVGAINEVNGKTLKTLVKSVPFGNTTAGTQISVDLSTATDGAITSYTQVKMFSLMYVVGSGNYDNGATVFCTDQNKLRLMPSMTQNNVSARLCFIY